MKNRDKNKVIYLYGIIPAPEGNTGFSPTGNHQMYTITYRDIAAVVSVNVRADHQRMNEEQIARSLLAYHEIIKSVMDTETAIIPLSFGTHAENEKAVIRILEKSYGLLRKVMNKISNHMEIYVTAKWPDLNRVLAEIADDHELTALKKETGKNKNIMSYADQVNTAHLLRTLLCKKKETYRMEILPALSALCHNIRHYEVMNDEVILNAALLVDPDLLLLIEKEIDRLDFKFNGKLHFKITGPFPCYSFYTMEIRELTYDEIKTARQALGLTNGTSLKSLKKAYFQKVKRFHPDSNPGTECMEGFSKITGAYRTLSDYLNAVDPAAGYENFTFPLEDENAFYLKVKDQSM